MGLDAGSATGQLELDIEGWKAGFAEAANAATQAEGAINSSMVSAGKEIDKLGDNFTDTAKETENLGKASVSLDEKLGSLLATAGSMATLKAGVSAIMGSVGDWAEAEASADRLRTALQFKGMESSFGMFESLASEMQKITGVSDDTVKQLAAESIAQGKSVQQTMDLLSAASAYSSATGEALEAVYDQFNKTLSGTAGRLGQTIPALKDFTEEQLRNGAALTYINEEYGAFTGKVGKTKIALDLMRETTGDASEAFGSAMAPVVLLVTGAITGLASVVANAGGVMKTVMAEGAVIVMSAFTALAIRTGILAAAKWGLFGAQMAVNAATAVGNPLLWVGIAAAVGLVAATGAIIAAKVKEAKATGDSSDATKENTKQIKTARDVLNQYTGDITKYSTAQLAAAKEDLQAARSKAKTMQEVADLTSRINVIEGELSKKRKADNEANAAAEYASVMADVRDTIAENVSEEDKLLAKISAVAKLKTESAADEKERLEALSLLRQALEKLRAETAEKEAEDEKKRAEDEQKILDDRRKAYEDNMTAVYGFLDERKQKEKELADQIAKLEAFKSNNQVDELLRLQAIKNAQDQLNELYEEPTASTFWERAGDAIDDYVDRMKNAQTSMKDVSSAFTSSASYLFTQAQAVSSQYYTNELANLDNAYKKQTKRLDDELEKGLISQEEYEKQKSELDKKAAEEKNELAKKQFEGEKFFKIGNVWMNAGNAIAGWWSAAPTLGPIAGPIFAGTMTGATITMAAEQTKLISDQQFVPSYATGGTHSGGIARINEEGPEIVSLPDGTIIVPNELSERIAAGQNMEPRQINVSFAGATITKDVNLDVLADKVSRQIAKKVRK